MNSNIEHVNGKSSFHKKLAPVALAAAALAEVHSIDVTIIDPSPTQPRKTFKNIDEMAASIKAHGVLQAVLLRPHPKKKGRYELVYGERRWRGAKLAGLTHIPATVRELTDLEVIEIQLIENAKRDDIHPLEEADSYDLLHSKYKLTVEEIAAKVGKSMATIYGRLKFCALIPEARKAFLDDKLTAATALLVARIPHEDLQKQALKALTTPGYHEELPGAREATRIVQEKFMLRLVDAPFDRADAKLVVAAGSCSACPKRTGNQRELFSDIETKDDLCTDPKCFNAKRDVVWEKKVAEAKAKGTEVLSAKAAKEVFPYGHTAVSGTSDYVDLAETAWDDAKNRTNRARLGKVELPITIARDPNGGIRELVPRKDFNKIVQAEKKTATKAKVKPDAVDESHAAEQKQRAKEKARRAAEVTEIVTKAEKRQPTDAFWRTLAMAVVRDSDFTCDEVFARRGIETGGQLDELANRDELVTAAIAKLTGGQARGMAVEVLATSTLAAENFTDFRRLYGTAKKPVAKKPVVKKTAKKKAKR